MPTYVYSCKKCGETWEAYNPFAKMADERCTVCMLRATVVPTAPSVRVFKPYTDWHITGKPIKIESWKQKNALLKAHNLRICEPGETDEQIRKYNRKRKRISANKGDSVIEIR